MLDDATLAQLAPCSKLEVLRIHTRGERTAGQEREPGCTNALLSGSSLHQLVAGCRCLTTLVLDAWDEDLCEHGVAQLGEVAQQLSGLAYLETVGSGPKAGQRSSCFVLMHAQPCRPPSNRALLLECYAWVCARTSRLH